MYEDITGKKYTIWKKVALLVPFAVFVVMSILPAQEKQFVAPVELASRDPYLAQAIDGLPEYAYTNAGSLAVSSVPVTQKGEWPAEFVKAVARAADIRPKVAQAAQIEQQISPKGTTVVLQGEASYYSRAGCLGCDPNMIMANGQPLNDNALTMAIGADRKHLVGRSAKVTSLATGKSVVVKITDTGGFYKAKYGNRVADLTVATKAAIGMKGGVGQVKVEVF